MKSCHPASPSFLLSVNIHIIPRAIGAVPKEFSHCLVFLLSQVGEFPHKSVIAKFPVELRKGQGVAAQKAVQVNWSDRGHLKVLEGSWKTQNNQSYKYLHYYQQIRKL